MAECFAEGARAGAEAARAAGFDAKPIAIPTVPASGQIGQGPIRVIPELPSNRPKHKVRAFIDLQDDVTTKDLGLAVKEGYRSVEHAKRYTTAGMGTDQGKVANLNAFGFLASVRGETIPAIGTTTFRQPYKPVTFAALAGQHVGDLFAPRRTTPMHDWHRAHGAVFEPVGDWLRARAYPKDGESFHEAVQREAKAARTTIGVLDASTLGKIDVHGPGRARVPEPRLHQRLVEARAGQGALRADARRGRHGDGRRRHRLPRRRPFPHDDDDRRRGARARQARGLSADRVAGPEGLSDQRHRAMGGRLALRAGVPQARDASSATTSTPIRRTSSS